MTNDFLKKSKIKGTSRGASPRVRAPGVRVEAGVQPRSIPAAAGWL